MLHWKPSLLGYTSFSTEEIIEVIDKSKEFPTESSIKLFRERTLKYIIFHRRFLRADDWEDIKRKLESFPRDIRFVREFGTDIVYEVAYE